ncbi:MAG: hypothetical protein DMG32_17820 [Acidobacteria bacterium]|nr:MAG: hypothetical protein DMG32_17820 [Acidobacteriota bacterium]
MQWIAILRFVMPSEARDLLLKHGSDLERRSLGTLLPRKSSTRLFREEAALGMTPIQVNANTQRRA